MFNMYKARANEGRDTTDYGALGGTRRFTGGFAVHYGELLSAAIVVGDAARSIRAMDTSTAKCRCAVRLQAGTGAGGGGHVQTDT